MLEHAIACMKHHAARCLMPTVSCPVQLAAAEQAERSWLTLHSLHCLCTHSAYRTHKSSSQQILKALRIKHRLTGASKCVTICFRHSAHLQLPPGSGFKCILKELKTAALADISGEFAAAGECAGGGHSEGGEGAAAPGSQGRS